MWVDVLVKCVVGSWAGTGCARSRDSPSRVWTVWRFSSFRGTTSASWRTGRSLVWAKWEFCEFKPSTCCFLKKKKQHKNDMICICSCFVTQRHLDFNSLREVNSGSLYGLKSLTQLYLSNNSISNFNPEGWGFCEKLRELWDISFLSHFYTVFIKSKIKQTAAYVQ